MFPFRPRPGKSLFVCTGVFNIVASFSFFRKERSPPLPPSRSCTAAGNSQFGYPHQTRMMKRTFPGNEIDSTFIRQINNPSRSSFDRGCQRRCRLTGSCDGRLSPQGSLITSTCHISFSIPATNLVWTFEAERIKIGKKKKDHQLCFITETVSSRATIVLEKFYIIFQSTAKQKSLIYICYRVFISPRLCFISLILHMDSLVVKIKTFWPFPQLHISEWKGALDTPEEISPLFDDTRPMCSTHDIITLFFFSFFDIFCFIAKWS